MSFSSRHFTPSSTNAWIKIGCAAIIPTLLGLLYNMLPRFLSPSSDIVMILFEMFCIFVPVIDLLLWFFLGKNLVSTVEKPVLGWLLLNWVGILSLLLFVWQFALIPENQQIGAIAIFCQQFGAGLALLTFNIGALFQPGSNTIELQGALAMQISALIFMMGASLLGVGIPKLSDKISKGREEKEKARKAAIRARAQMSGKSTGGKKK